MLIYLSEGVHWGMWKNQTWELEPTATSGVLLRQCQWG